MGLDRVGVKRRERRMERTKKNRRRTEDRDDRGNKMGKWEDGENGRWRRMDRGDLSILVPLGAYSPRRSGQLGTFRSLHPCSYFNGIRRALDLTLES